MLLRTHELPVKLNRAGGHRSVTICNNFSRLGTGAGGHRSVTICNNFSRLGTADPRPAGRGPITPTPLDPGVGLKLPYGPPLAGVRPGQWLWRAKRIPVPPIVGGGFPGLWPLGGPWLPPCPGLWDDWPHWPANDPSNVGWVDEDEFPGGEFPPPSEHPPDVSGEPDPGLGWPGAGPGPGAPPR